MKQITIYDLLPLLKKGWVACDGNGWAWFTNKPEYKLDKLDYDYRWMIRIGDGYNISGKCCPFNIKPFDGDWKDSLIKIDHFHQQGKMVKEEDTLLMVDKSTGPEWYKNGKRIK